MDQPADSSSIRPFRSEDKQGVWEIFHEVVSAGDTYGIDPDTTREEAMAFWVRGPRATYVAELPDGTIGGTYFIRTNQAGPGSHVCNAGFMVRGSVRGRGIGRKMGRHALSEARHLGYEAMQFNFVVSTNEGAVHLWRELGFEILGTLPGAFDHPEEGRVDAYVMYRML